MVTSYVVTILIITSLFLLQIMADARRKCLNSPDAFCYICGSFTVPSQRMNISDFVKVYLAYFHVRLGDQHKSWAPHQLYKPSVENLRQWTKGKREN